MLFTHDTEVGLGAIAALVNTAHLDGREELVDVDALEAFIHYWRWTGEHRHDVIELEAVCALRPILRRLWEIDEDSAVDLVNELLRNGRALPQLVKHDGWNYHLHATPTNAPLADRMAVDAAMALTDIIRQEEFSRLQVCAADDCDDVLVDLSKNRSRRFCSPTCANRTNVAAYRARQAHLPSPQRGA